MDDPWGSPWAADDNPPRLDLPAPPPLVHTPRIPNRATSPWEGASGQEEEENPWGNISGGAFTGSGSESPGWGRNPGKSPSLRPARSGTVNRQPSWGSLGQRSEDLEVARPIASLGSLNGDSARSSHDVTATDGHLPPLSEPKTNDDGDGRLNDSKPSHDIRKNDNDTESEMIPNNERMTPSGSPKPTAQVGNRPRQERQVSKVQELVDMYDGIEKKRDEPNEAPMAGPRIKLVGSPIEDGAEGTDQAKIVRLAKDSDVDNDEGAVVTSNDESEEVTTATIDYDAGQQNHAKDDDLIRHESVVEQGRAAAGEAVNEETQSHSDAQFAIQEDDHGPSAISTGMTADTSEDNHFTAIPLPSTPFSVDLSQMDSLFPSAEASTVEAEPVPDVIIDDTFASISERKTWYRVSRPGPMRQHNLGNDEDYVRLDWRHSETRTGCLKIVRRWMEEDSIAGRVGVGRRMKGMGIGGAGMFGWNSKEPEVGIDQLLSKNRGHMRGISVISQESKITEPSVASPTVSTFSPTSPTRTGFGWECATSSRFPPDVTASKAGDASKRSSWVVPKPTVASEPSKRNSWIAPPPVIPLPREKALAKTDMMIDSVVANEWASSAGESRTNGTIADDGDEADDDDDWGEMVTSPPLSTEPVVATSLGDTRDLPSMSDLAKTSSASPFPTTTIEDNFTEFESAWGSAQPEATFTNSESSQGLLGDEDQLHTMENSTEALKGPTAKSSMLVQPTHESFGITSVLADLDTTESNDEKRKQRNTQVAKAGKDINDDEVRLSEPLATLQPSRNLVLTTAVESPVSTRTPPNSLAPKKHKTLSEEEEATAHQILRNLPDLSYMLR